MLIAIAVSSGLGLGAAPALAECTTGGPGIDNMVCSGVISISRNAGASADTIDFRDGASLNAGVIIRADGATGYNDTINFQAGSPSSTGITLNGTVRGDDGNDTINVLSGSKVTITGTGFLAGNEGTDTFNIDGSLTINNAGELNAGDGGDTLTVGGTVSNSGYFRAGEGNNTTTISTGATFTNTATGAVASGTGVDKLIIQGTFINQGDGTDAGSGSVNTGDGNDTIEISGTLTNSGKVNGGDGDNTFTIDVGGEVTNSATGFLAAGTGNDTFNINGKFTNGNEFNSGGGNDTLNVDGEVDNTGFFRMGDGSDHLTIGGKFINTGSGEIIGGIGTNTVTVEADGLLQAALSIDLGGNTSKLDNAGTLRIGGEDEIITTALVGNLQQSAGGELAVDVDMAADSADLLTVTGDADLSGSVNVKLRNQQLVNRQYTLVSANGILTDNGWALTGVTDTQVIHYALSTTPGDLNLDVTVDFAGATGLTRNQRAVADDFNGIAAAASGDFQTLLLAVASLTDAAGYRNALDQLAGAEYAQELQSVLWSTRLLNGLIADRMDCGAADPLRKRPSGAAAGISASTGCIERGTAQVWMSGTGNRTSADGDKEAPGYDQGLFNLVGGVDYAFTGDLFAGAAVGYLNSQMDFDRWGGRSGTSIDYEGWQAAVYGGFDNGLLYARGSLAYGAYSGDSRRAVAIGDVGGDLAGSPDSHTLSFYGETGYRLALSDSAVFTPFAGVTLASATLEGFTEKDAGGTGAALKVGDSSAQSTESNLGLRFETSLATGGGVLVPSLALSWAHEFGDTVQDVSMRFAESPAGSGFGVISSDTARDTALVAAGASYAVDASGEVGLYYTGRFNADYDSQAVTARAIYRF